MCIELIEVEGGVLSCLQTMPATKDIHSIHKKHFIKWQVVSMIQ